MQKHAHIIIYAELVVILALIGALIYGYTVYSELRTTLSSELKTTKETLAERDEKLITTEALVQITRQELASSEENGAELLNLLNDEKDRNEEFEDRIDDLTGTVGKLDKLSKTDPELLIKYSRVYFLNENYIPEKIEKINSEFLVKKEEPEYINAKVADRLSDLLEDAKEDGVDLLVLSGYRSFDEQMSLKSAYTTTYGSGANALSADQGYSEHQLGTTIDFTTSLIGASLSGFENTTSYTWLQNNAYKYGFVISYPKENIYYIFEPWHWRFVGEKLAKDLHDDKGFFYGMDQREIDKYLISIFD